MADAMTRAVPPPGRPFSVLLTLTGLADRQILTRLVVTGCVSATANLVSLISLSAELSGWLRGEVLDTPFLVFCASLLVGYAAVPENDLDQAIGAILDVRAELART